MIKLTKPFNLKGYTLILPSVAVGNVAQLTVDLLIASLNLEKIGQILTTAFIPIVGLDSYSETSDNLCTAVDVYAGIKNQVVVIQIRSPFVRTLNDFYHHLLQFVTENKILKVVILTSSYAYEKTGSQLNITDLRYIPSADILTDNKQIFKDLQWIQCESIHTPSSSKEVIHIPGGGFAKNLFDFFSSINISCIILFKFCSEGDNIPDALDLINYLNQWMKLLQNNSNGSLVIKYPPSWKYLFGNVVSSEIY